MGVDGYKPQIEDKVFGDRFFPKQQMRAFNNLQPIIGADAAIALARQFGMRLASSWLSLLVIGMIVLTEFRGGPILLGITLICCAMLLACGVPVVSYGKKGSKLARTYVSEQLGYDIGHIGGNTRPATWSRSIERMKRRHDRRMSR